MLLSRNGRADPYRDWHDTVLLDARETNEVAFDVSNLGKWPLQVGAMIARFEVA